MTRGAITIYTSNPERPYLVRLKTLPRVRSSRRLLLLCLIALVIPGAFATLWLARADDIGTFTTLLILLPVTLAGAVVLSREATSLAERMLRRLRVVLILGTSPPPPTRHFSGVRNRTSTLSEGGLPHSRRGLRHPTAATVAVRDMVRERPSPIRPSPTPLAAGAAPAHAG